MSDPKASVKLLAFSGAVLAMAAAWSAWAGVRLASVKKQAEVEGNRLDSVHGALADEAFRAELKDTLEAKSKDTQPFRGRLSDLARKAGIALDGSILETPPIPLPILGLRQVDTTLTFKDVPLWRFIDYARAVEQDVPDAVVTDVTLKPMPSAGDRWEVHLKISKRTKAQ